MSEPRTAAERDLCDVLYHSEFHISREQANISGRLMYDAMLARGYRIEAEAAALPAAPQTEAGRELDEIAPQLWRQPSNRSMPMEPMQLEIRKAVLNIESEAQRLTVERLELAEWEQVQLDAIRYRSQQAYIGVGPERLATIDVAWLLDRLDRALARKETRE